MATHPPESVVTARNTPGIASRIASRRREREREAVRQRLLINVMTVEGGEVCQGADCPIHCSSVRGCSLGLRLEPAFRGDGPEDRLGVGRVHDGEHRILVREHLRELVQPGR